MVLSLEPEAGAKLPRNRANEYATSPSLTAVGLAAMQVPIDTIGREEENRAARRPRCGVRRVFFADSRTGLCVRQGMPRPPDVRTGGGLPHEELSRSLLLCAWSRMTTLGRRHLASRRRLFLLVAACVLGVAATPAGAAPIYTNWTV